MWDLKRLLAVVGTLVVAISLAACATKPTIAKQPSSITKTSTATVPTILVVKNHWKPGVPQLGIDVLWSDNPANEPNTYIQLEANRILNYIVGLGANSVAISFPFFNSTGPSSSSVKAESGTPSPTKLAVLVIAAKARGLRVTLRPLMDESNLSPGWRGNITPGNIGKWLASYYSFLQPYLRMAKTTDVNTFILGAEFSSIQDNPQWKSVIQKASAIYPINQIGYSDNYDRFYEGDFGPSVRILGVDAYFPVKLPNSASVQELVRGWDSYLSQVTGKVNLSRVVIDEIGISAVSSAYAVPYGTSSRKQTILPQIQINWFETACQVFRNYHMSGIYFWNVNLNQNPATANPRTDPAASFIGRGDQAIRKCFTS